MKTLDGTIYFKGISSKSEMIRSITEDTLIDIVGILLHNSERFYPVCKIYKTDYERHKEDFEKMMLEFPNASLSENDRYKIIEFECTKIKVLMDRFISHKIYMISIYESKGEREEKRERFEIADFGYQLTAFDISESTHENLLSRINKSTVEIDDKDNNYFIIRFK